MQIFDKDNEVIKAMIRDVDGFEELKADRVVMARIDPGLIFYIKGLKFELTGVDEATKTITAKLVDGPAPVKP